MKTAKQFLEDKGILPWEPIYWYGDDEYITMESVMESYAKLILEEAAERAMVQVENYKDLTGKRITDNNSNTYIVNKKSITG